MLLFFIKMDFVLLLGKIHCSSAVPFISQFTEVCRLLNVSQGCIFIICMPAYNFF